MSAQTLTIWVGWVEVRDPTSSKTGVNLQFITNQPDMISTDAQPDGDLANRIDISHEIQQICHRKGAWGLSR